MKLRIVTTGLLCFAALIPSAMGADKSTESSPQALPDDCIDALLSPSPETYNQVETLCRDFINKIVETSGYEAVVRVDHGKGVVSEYSFCFPNGLRHDDLAMVLVRWAHRHPEKSQEHLEAGLLDAVEEVFPCEGPWDQERKRARAKKPAAGDKHEIPDRCPLCGSDQILVGVFGLPGSDFDTTRYFSHGCMVFSGAPRWACAKCGHQWGLLDPRMY